MDVIDDPDNWGKLLVLFNGTEINCSNGTDCQGAAICAINQTWMANQTTGVCMCNTKFGLTGYYCDEWCAQAVAILVVNLTLSTVALVLSVISIYLLFVMITRHNTRRTRHRCNPVMITLILIAIGSLCFVVAPILAICDTLGFPWMYYLVQDGPLYDKRAPQALDSATSIMYPLAYCFTVCSFVVLPLTWIDVAQNSLKLRKTQTTAVIGFTCLIVVITLAIQVPLYMLMSSAYRSQAPRWVLGIIIGWAIIFSFTMFLNALAYHRVSNIKRSAMVTDADYFSSGLSRLLTRVQVSAAQIFIASLFAVVTVEFFRPRSFRTYYSDPYCYFDTIDIVFRISTLFVQYGCAVALWFVAPSATGRKATTLPASALRPSRQQPVVPQKTHSSIGEDTPKVGSRVEVEEKLRAISPQPEGNKPNSPVNSTASNVVVLAALMRAPQGEGQSTDQGKDSPRRGEVAQS